MSKICAINMSLISIAFSFINITTDPKTTVSVLTCPNKNVGLKTELKKACLWSEISGIQMVGQVMWLYHLITWHQYCPVFRCSVLRWLLYKDHCIASNMRYPCTWLRTKSNWALAWSILSPSYRQKKARPNRCFGLYMMIYKKQVYYKINCTWWSTKTRFIISLIVQADLQKQDRFQFQGLSNFLVETPFQH